MRNYYASLETRRDYGMSTIVARLQQLQTLEPELARKGEKILLSGQCKEVYDQVHFQYEAIALAYQAFKSEIDDTNNWDRRLVEFITPED